VARPVAVAEQSSKRFIIRVLGKDLFPHRMPLQNLEPIQLTGWQTGLLESVPSEATNYRPIRHFSLGGGWWSKPVDDLHSPIKLNIAPQLGVSK
jgi:hypothetical protein